MKLKSIQIYGFMQFMEKNPDIIHFLEEIDIEPNIKCIKESIKFFHNEITEYLFDNYSDKLH